MVFGAIRYPITIFIMKLEKKEEEALINGILPLLRDDVVRVNAKNEVRYYLNKQGRKRAVLVQAGTTGKVVNHRTELLRIIKKAETNEQMVDGLAEYLAKFAKEKTTANQQKETEKDEEQ